MLTNALAVPERRHTTTPDSVSPEDLIARHISDAREQLADGRERLKAARRRVVQLEDALANWERLAAEMRAKRARSAA
jgi:phage shock protein A